MANWPAENIEKRPVTKLIPYARNSRTHSEEQVAQIAASINEWGWTIPCLIDPDGGIIAGHGRILAAQKLGIKEVPCMIAEGWTDAQKRAYVIADNKLALNAGWDDEMLKVELGELSDLDFDLSLTGFDDAEIAGFLEGTPEGNTDPDETPDLQEEAVTVKGDTWLLGKHRLRCGDSTSANDVAALLNGVEPHLMVTDPPYGVNYDPAWRGGTERTGKVQNDDKTEWAEVWLLFPGEVAYVWHGYRQSPITALELEQCGFDLRALIVWAKDRAPISRGDYHHQHETCWYAVKKKGKGHWSGDRKQTTLWKIDSNRNEQKTNHGTQKPVECMRRPIVNNSSSGQAVYEPFCGSGTTIIAGEMEGRHIYAMELDENYCDVIVRRWQDFTGQQATLETTGQTFEEVATQRSTVEAA